VTEEDSKELASRISFEIVKDIAPKELPLFDDFKEKFLRNPKAFEEKDRKKREKMLGFALTDAVTPLLTAFVLPSVFGAIKKHSAKKRGEKLNRIQLVSLRKQAFDNAISLGLNKAKAELMADSLVGKMAMLYEMKSDAP
jgi:hypothetical protein